MNLNPFEFETAPTGELLTWLQANAVKQEPTSDVVTSLGGATGDITLGSGLSMSGNQLSASGGGGGSGHTLSYYLVADTYIDSITN